MRVTKLIMDLLSGALLLLVFWAGEVLFFLYTYRLFSRASCRA